MIGRLMKMTAQPGRGPELADLLLRVTESLRDFPGCKFYAIAQDTKDPDTVRVIEAWQDEESAQQALTSSPTNSDAPKCSLSFRIWHLSWEISPCVGV
jgi:quinol monooxygenase YgiN